MRDQLRVSKEVRRSDRGSIGACLGEVINITKHVYMLTTYNEKWCHEKSSFRRFFLFRLRLCTPTKSMTENTISQAEYLFDVTVKFGPDPTSPRRR